MTKETEVTQIDNGPIVQSVVMAVYHHWMTATPSNYPPNLYSRVKSVDGAIVQRDFKPVVGIGYEDYKKYNACDAKYVELLWEFTPNGVELKKRMIVKVEMRTIQTYWSFGSCNSCWKRGRRNFTDITTTRHPLSVPADNPSTPRLGRCGCVVCNECVLEIEMNPNNSGQMDVHCPYCGNKECFSKHMRIWLVSMEVSNDNTK